MLSEYVYAADGTRLKKIENGATTLTFANVEIRNFEGSGTTVLTYPHPAIRFENGNAQSYLHRDHLDSIRLITSASGEVEHVRTFKPFGEMRNWADAAAITETKGWIGERFDAGAGLQYLNARYYDPELGLFLQPDWFEVTEPGVGTNRYAYSANDPVNFKDTSGNNFVKEIFEGVFGKASKNMDSVAKDAAMDAIENGMRELRDYGIKEAWHQERALLALNNGKGRGTRRWTEKQRKTILGGGTVKGYFGHHINNVAAHPSQAGDPSNIQFLTRVGHNKAHPGGTRIPTTGPLINRNAEFRRQTGRDIPKSGNKVVTYDGVLDGARAAAQSSGSRLLRGVSRTLNALPPDPLSMGIDYITGKWGEDTFFAYCDSNPGSCG